MDAANHDDPGYDYIANRMFKRKAGDMFIYYDVVSNFLEYDKRICTLYLKKKLYMMKYCIIYLIRIIHIMIFT